MSVRGGIRQRLRETALGRPENVVGTVSGGVTTPGGAGASFSRKPPAKSKEKPNPGMPLSIIFGEGDGK